MWVSALLSIACPPLTVEFDLGARHSAVNTTFFLSTYHPLSQVDVPLGTTITVYFDKDVKTVNINKLFEVPETWGDMAYKFMLLVWRNVLS